MRVAFTTSVGHYGPTLTCHICFSGEGLQVFEYYVRAYSYVNGRQRDRVNNFHFIFLCGDGSNYIWLQSLGNEAFCAFLQVYLEHLDDLPVMEGRPVLIVDEILESGRTLSEVVHVLESRTKAKSIGIATLMQIRYFG